MNTLNKRRHSVKVTNIHLNLKQNLWSSSVHTKSELHFSIVHLYFTSISPLVCSQPEPQWPLPIDQMQLVTFSTALRCGSSLLYLLSSALKYTLLQVFVPQTHKSHKFRKSLMTDPGIITARSGPSRLNKDLCFVWVLNSSGLWFITNTFIVDKNF